MKICLHKFMELVGIDYRDPDNHVVWSLKISNGRILMGKDKERNKSRDMKHEIEKAKKAAGERVPSDASSEPTPVLNSVPQFPWEDVPGDNSSEQSWLLTPEMDSPWNGAFDYADFELDPSW